MNLQILGCHPGFILDPKSDSCVCDSSNGNILRCDDNNRYLFLRVSNVSHYCSCTYRTGSIIIPPLVPCKRGEGVYYRMYYAHAFSPPSPFEGQLPLRVILPPLHVPPAGHSSPVVVCSSCKCMCVASVYIEAEDTYRVR